MNQPATIKTYNPDTRQIVYKPHRFVTFRDEDPQKVSFTTGEVSEMIGISGHRIRSWCNELGLNIHRGARNCRKFNREQINKLKLVAAMVNDGVHLWKIKETLNKKS